MKNHAIRRPHDGADGFTPFTFTTYYSRSAHDAASSSSVEGRVWGAQASAQLASEGPSAVVAAASSGHVLASYFGCNRMQLSQFNVVHVFDPKRRGGTAAPDVWLADEGPAATKTGASVVPPSPSALLGASVGRSPHSAFGSGVTAAKHLSGSSSSSVQAAGTDGSSLVRRDSSSTSSSAERPGLMARPPSSAPVSSSVPGSRLSSLAVPPAGVLSVPPARLSSVPPARSPSVPPAGVLSGAPAALQLPASPGASSTSPSGRPFSPSILTSQHRTPASPRGTPGSSSAAATAAAPPLPRLLHGLDIAPSDRGAADGVAAADSLPLGGSQHSHNLMASRHHPSGAAGSSAAHGSTPGHQHRPTIPSSATTPLRQSVSDAAPRALSAAQLPGASHAERAACAAATAAVSSSNAPASSISTSTASPAAAGARPSALSVPLGTDLDAAVHVGPGRSTSTFGMSGRGRMALHVASEAVMGGLAMPTGTADAGTSHNRTAPASAGAAVPRPAPAPPIVKATADVRPSTPIDAVEKRSSAASSKLGVANARLASPPACPAGASADVAAAATRATLHASTPLDARLEHGGGSVGGTQSRASGTAASGTEVRGASRCLTRGSSGLLSQGSLLDATAGSAPRSSFLADAAVSGLRVDRVLAGGGSGVSGSDPRRPASLSATAAALAGSSSGSRRSSGPTSEFRRLHMHTPSSSNPSAPSSQPSGPSSHPSGPSSHSFVPSSHPSGPSSHPSGASAAASSGGRRTADMPLPTTTASQPGMVRASAAAPAAAAAANAAATASVALRSTPPQLGAATQQHPVRGARHQSPLLMAANATPPHSQLSPSGASHARPAPKPPAPPPVTARQSSGAAAAAPPPPAGAVSSALHTPQAASQHHQQPQQLQAFAATLGTATIPAAASVSDGVPQPDPPVFTAIARPDAVATAAAAAAAAAATATAAAAREAAAAAVAGPAATTAPSIAAAVAAKVAAATAAAAAGAPHQQRGQELRRPAPPATAAVAAAAAVVPPSGRQELRRPAPPATAAPAGPSRPTGRTRGLAASDTPSMPGAHASSAAAPIAVLRVVPSVVSPAVPPAVPPTLATTTLRTPVGAGWMGGPVPGLVGREDATAVSA